MQHDGFMSRIMIKILSRQAAPQKSDACQINASKFREPKATCHFIFCITSNFQPKIISKNITVEYVLDRSFNGNGNGTHCIMNIYGFPKNRSLRVPAYQVWGSRGQIQPLYWDQMTWD